jgi:hypothetical protein
MPSYDPQRNRPRQRPSDDEPTAVDALLDAADVEPAAPSVRDDITEETPVVVAPVAPVAAAAAEPAAHVHVPDGGHDHDHHGHDHDHHDHDHHDHDHDLEDIALVPIVAVAGVLAGALVIVWRWRRRKSG